MAPFRKHLRKLAFLLCGGALLTMAAGSQQAAAADIRLVGNQIEITGDIVEGDFEKFDRITEQSNWPRNPVVRLRSNGGRVNDAIRIGLTLRQKGYHTYGDRGDCASACALIWLAGTKRFRHPENRMGFHQTYDEHTQRAQGNAVVGFYLAQLNLDYDVTLFVTEAAPRRMKWLNEDNAEKIGVRYTTQAISIHDIAISDVPVPRLRAVVGTLQYADGRSYSGDLNSGKPDGYGAMVWSNGDRYQGEWEAGYQSGQGLFTGSGHVYAGKWKQGEKHGYGQEHGNWGQYRGDFRRGSWHGHGTLLMANGDTHVGYFADGVAQGDGRLQFSGDRLYTGEFARGLFDGQGRLTINRRLVYEGQWQRGLPHGEGRYTFDNGDVHVGQWKNGLRHGKGRLTTVDGSTSEGVWRNGLKDGPLVHTAPGQPTTRFEYAAGIPLGSSTVRQSAIQKSATETQSEVTDGGPHEAILTEISAKGNSAVGHGSVHWQFAGSQVGSGGLPGGLISGRITLPERGLHVDLMIGPQAFGGNPVEFLADIRFSFDEPDNDNPAMSLIALSATHPERGVAERLVGLPTIVNDNHFRFVFKGFENSESRTRRFLRESDWINLNFVFNDGTRGTLRLEKGPSGKAVFAKAIPRGQDRPSSGEKELQRDTDALQKPAFSIQLASRNSNGEAERTIEALTRIYPELFDGRQVFVEESAAPGSRTVFKIHVAAQDRVDARIFCRAFRDHGRSCLILRN